MKIPITVITILALLCITCRIEAQSHKATKAEVEFQNRVIKTLFNSLPKNYKGWGRDLPIGDGDDNQINEGQNISDCQGDECYEWIEAIATYSGSRVPGGEAEMINKQKAETKDDELKRALTWRLQNNFGLSIRLMTNVTSDVVHYTYCKDGGLQKLPPPPGWDSYVFVTLSPCKKDSERDLGDYNIFSMGPLPKQDHGHNVFQLNPALKGAHKVQNIVLVLEGSREVAQDFVKNMNTEALRSLMK